MRITKEFINRFEKYFVSALKEKLFFSVKQRERKKQNLLYKISGVHCVY
jgi:hypothetical protein